MAIELLRVDDRLVHGQVVEGWVPHLKSELVVVVSDAAAGDEVQTTLMRMALPPATGLKVLSVCEAPAYLAGGEVASKRSLVLVPSPSEALALLEAGVKATRVNVGGLHHTAGKVQLGRALFLDDKDAKALRAIAARGVKLEGRALPGDAVEDILTAMEGK